MKEEFVACFPQGVFIVIGLHRLCSCLRRRPYLSVYTASDSLELEFHQHDCDKFTAEFTECSTSHDGMSKIIALYFI